MTFMQTYFKTVLIFSFFLLCKIFNVQAQFVTTWQTTTANESIIIPTAPSFLGATYNYNVNWGDGDVENGLTGNATHMYATPGIHTVRITGMFP